MISVCEGNPEDTSSLWWKSPEDTASLWWKSPEDTSSLWWDSPQDTSSLWWERFFLKWCNAVVTYKTLKATEFVFEVAR